MRLKRRMHDNQAQTNPQEIPTVLNHTRLHRLHGDRDGDRGIPAALRWRRRRRRCWQWKGCRLCCYCLADLPQQPLAHFLHETVVRLGALAGPTEALGASQRNLPCPTPTKKKGGKSRPHPQSVFPVGLDTDGG